jgi:sorbitol-specific phosphotransferase system component IIBC
MIEILLDGKFIPWNPSNKHLIVDDIFRSSKIKIFKNLIMSIIKNVKYMQEVREMDIVVPEKIQAAKEKIRNEMCEKKDSRIGIDVESPAGEIVAVLAKHGITVGLIDQVFDRAKSRAINTTIVTTDRIFMTF